VTIRGRAMVADLIMKVVTGTKEWATEKTRRPPAIITTTTTAPARLPAIRG